MPVKLKTWIVTVTLAMLYCSTIVKLSCDGVVEDVPKVKTVNACLGCPLPPAATWKYDESIELTLEGMLPDVYVPSVMI